MERIGREYEYSSACYRMGAHPGPNSTKYYYTEYVEYKDGRPYFIQKWDGGRETTDSEPRSAEGKKFFPNLTQKCPGCGQRLNLTEETCDNWRCARPIDNPIVLEPEPEQNPCERILELLLKKCQELQIRPNWEGRIKDEIRQREKAIIDLCEVSQDIRIDLETKKAWGDKIKQLAENVHNYGSHTKNAEYMLSRLWRRRFKIQNKKEKENESSGESNS